MSDKLNSAIAVVGIDIGKNSFHVVGHETRGAIILRQSGRAGRSKHGSPTCHRVISMEACVGAHHLSRKVHTL